MPPSNSTYAERERHRREFYARHKHIKRPSENGNDFFSFNPQLHAIASKYSVLIVGFAILFSIGFIVTNIKGKVGEASIDLRKKSFIELSIPAGGKIYTFNLHQYFSPHVAPQYSELEVELLDHEYNHVYSFYKDLWQERHPNGDGGTSVYKDIDLNFEIELAKKGTYYLRVVSHNKNTSDIKCSVKSRSFGGHLYFGFYALLFIILCIILLVGRSIWGSPSQLKSSFPTWKKLRSDRTFMILFGGCLIVFIGCVFISFMHYGYAAGGDKIIVPTYFFGTDNVTYIG